MNRKLFVAVQLGLLTLLVGTIAAAAPTGAPTGAPADEWAGQSQPQSQPPSGGRAAPLDPEGTGFTYQGLISDGGVLAHGYYDFVFKVYDSPTGGAQVGNTNEENNRLVDYGRLTTYVDPGPGTFTGGRRWLEVAIRPAGGGGYTILAPRQEITAAPYALGLVPGASITGAAGLNPLLKLQNTGSGAGLEVSAATGLGAYIASVNGRSADFYGNASDFAVSIFNANSLNTSTALNARSYYGIGGYFEGGTYGVQALNSGFGPGVDGTSNEVGVHGFGGQTGVEGECSVPCTGVKGTGSTGVQGVTNGGYGVHGVATNGSAVVGEATSGTGGRFTSDAYYAMYASSNTGSAAQFQSFAGPLAVDIVANQGTGANFTGLTGGLRATSSGMNSTAISGTANLGTAAIAVDGFSTNGFGVYGRSVSGSGVHGESDTGAGGTFHTFQGDGIRASSAFGRAGWFNGRVEVKGNITVTGNLTVTGNIYKGGGGFMIDHPLDPENKYLYHSFVESPDMKNVYDGNVTTDARGEATVALPDYFEAVNRDYRYQLTVIGQFAQAIVSRKIENNRFTIRTDKPNVEVSWQVTGIRRDPYAERNRIQTEVEKSEREKGQYLHPTVWGQPESKGIGYRESQNIPPGEQSTQTEQAQRAGGR
jgi:hypothetical protein